MKSSYEQELEFLLSSPRRARANRTRIEELKAILADLYIIESAQKRADK